MGSGKAECITDRVMTVNIGSDKLWTGVNPTPYSPLVCSGEPPVCAAVGCDFYHSVHGTESGDKKLSARHSSDDQKSM